MLVCRTVDPCTASTLYLQGSPGETMPRKSKTDAAAIRAGQDHAKIILKMRAQKLKRRTAVLRSLPPVKAVQAGRFSAALGLVMAAGGETAGGVGWGGGISVLLSFPHRFGCFVAQHGRPSVCVGAQR